MVLYLAVLQAVPFCDIDSKKLSQHIGLCVSESVPLNSFCYIGMAKICCETIQNTNLPQTIGKNVIIKGKRNK